MIQAPLLWQAAQQRSDPFIMPVLRKVSQCLLPLYFIIDMDEIRAVMMIYSESWHQILIHTACAIYRSMPPWLLLGVKKERGRRGLGEGSPQWKTKTRAFLVLAEGTRGALLNMGLPCFHDSTAETASATIPASAGLICVYYSKPEDCRWGTGCTDWLYYYLFLSLAFSLINTCTAYHSHTHMHMLWTVHNPTAEGNIFSWRLLFKSWGNGTNSSRRAGGRGLRSSAGNWIQGNW